MLSPSHPCAAHVAALGGTGERGERRETRAGELTECRELVGNMSLQGCLAPRQQPGTPETRGRIAEFLLDTSKNVVMYCKYLCTFNIDH